MKTGSATGFQIAFFTFAAVFLMVPLWRWVAKLGAWPPEYHALLEKAIPFFLAVVILGSVPLLRRWYRQELARPIPDDARAELLAVAAAKVFLPFAAVGMLVLWWWMSEGPGGLAQRIRTLKSHEWEMAKAFSFPGLVEQFLIGVTLAPVLEELIFRGFLYRAWERQWGCIPAMLLTSVVFGLYHSMFLPAFLASIVYVCLYRRMGTLWAPIIVHAIFNSIIWYPLAGRYVLPRDLDAPGDLGSWTFHLACLLFGFVALTFYVWLSRGPVEQRTTALDTGHEPVPQ